MYQSLGKRTKIHGIWIFYHTGLKMQKKTFSHFLGLVSIFFFFAKCYLAIFLHLFNMYASSTWIGIFKNS